MKHCRLKNWGGRNKKNLLEVKKNVLVGKLLQPKWSSFCWDLFTMLQPYNL